MIRRWTDVGQERWFRDDAATSEALVEARRDAVSRVWGRFVWRPVAEQDSFGGARPAHREALKAAAVLSTLLETPISYVAGSRPDGCPTLHFGMVSEAQDGSWMRVYAALGTSSVAEAGMVVLCRDIYNAKEITCAEAHR
jgi:hypothetical protein